MNRVMGDSTTLDDIPTDVSIVASYINGTFAITPVQMESRFPNARYGHCWIDVRGTAPEANARDWENGDKAGSLQQWVIDHNTHSGKKDAVIYCNVSTIPEVRNLTGNQILDKDYFLWIATLDGQEYTGSGIVACQRDGEMQTGGHWDRSFVYNDSLWVPTGSGFKEPDCSKLQTAVHTTADGIWGSETDQHCTAVYRAGLSEFPYSVKFAQACVGTPADGMWGTKSETMLKATVINVQKALAAMGFNPRGVDGVWGQNTMNAYEEAWRACHN